MTRHATQPRTAELADLVIHAARSLRRRWSAALEPWELSPHQARALRVVCDSDGGLRLTDLAKALRIAPRSATEVVDGLEVKGLLDRVTDPADRRAVCVAPTDEGRRLQADVDAARATDAADYFSVLSPEERETITRILARLHDQPTD